MNKVLIVILSIFLVILIWTGTYSSQVISDEYSHVESAKYDTSNHSKVVDISDFIRDRKEYFNDLHNSYNFDNISKVTTAHVYYYNMSIKSAAGDYREQELLNTIQGIESQLEEMNEEESWYNY